MFCENCGKQIPDGSKFCGNCGSKQTEGGQAPAGNAATPPPVQNVPPVQSQPVVQTAPPPPPPPPAPAPQQNYMPPQQQYNPYAPRPEDRSPLSVGNYIVMYLLMLVPILNIILLFMWGFGSDVNVNKKNWAKAMLIIMLIGVAIGIIFSIIGGLIAASIASSLYY